MPISLASPMLIGALLAGPPKSPPSNVPPGGYWTVAEAHEREVEPPDGEDEIALGGALFSLGAIRVGAAGLSIWMAGNPRICDVDTPQRCAGFRIYGYVGLGEGALMLGTGIAYLVMGLSHRNRHRRWKGGERLGSRLQVSPWLARTPERTLAGGGLTLSLRF